MAIKNSDVDLAASRSFEKALEMALEIHRRIVHNLENGHAECAASIARRAIRHWEEDIHNERHFRKTYMDIAEAMEDDKSDKELEDTYDYVGDRLERTEPFNGEE